uniref:Uncharacterized protein n=1 Tax=Ursus americanus TaxID=9643 RepID=A0A452SLF9_URSAM
MSGLPVARTCPGLGEASDLKFPLGAKFREPLTETRFQQLFGDAKQELEPLAEPRLSRLCRQWRRRARACSGPGAWRLLLARLPPLHLSFHFSPRHGFCPPDLRASGVRALHFFLPRPHLHLVGYWETPVHRNFRGTQPHDGLGRGAWNREGTVGRSAGWGGCSLGLRERGSDAGYVRAAARGPVHLFVGACGQSADQRGRAARARVPTAEPFRVAPSAPDWLLRSLQDAGRCADRAAPEQSGRTDHLGTQPGAARAGQRIEREIPRQATHPDPRGNRHGASGLCALLHLFPGHKIQRPDSGAAAWRISPAPPPQHG